MKKTLLLSLAGGLVLFVWGFISWAVLPWHNLTANKFLDEAAVSRVLKDNAPKQGVYFLPFSEQDHGPDQVGAFANVLPHGTEMQMGRQMALALLTQILSAWLVLCLLSMTGHPTYLGKVGFFALVGLVIGFVSHAPYWNWFGFSTPYVAVMIIDTSIAWTLAGLVMAKFSGAKTAPDYGGRR